MLFLLSTWNKKAGSSALTEEQAAPAPMRYDCAR